MVQPALTPAVQWNPKIRPYPKDARHSQPAEARQMCRDSVPRRICPFLESFFPLPFPLDMVLVKWSFLNREGICIGKHARGKKHYASYFKWHLVIRVFQPIGCFCLFLWFFANNTVFLQKTADPRVESSLFMLH